MDFTGWDSTTPEGTLLRSLFGVAHEARRTPPGLAFKIEHEISSAGWPEGQVFGSEPELMARYGVSRAALREAARLLEHREVAVMRRGPSGGLVVRTPDVSAVTTAAVVYLEYVGTTLQHVLEARTALEPTIAALAATNLNEAGIVQLRLVLVEEDWRRREAGSALNSDQMHVRLGDVCGNTPISTLAHTLVRLTYRYAEASEQVARERIAVADQVEHAHDRITESVIAGDSGAAFHRARLHVLAIEEYLLRKNPDPLTYRARLTPEDLPTSKLAPRVAEQIRADILAVGWPTGKIVASEGELLGRHGVARATLREALRILEHHSVARMRRGQRGGLLVLAPDPRASVTAMSAFLASRRIDRAEMTTARTILELACFDLIQAKSPPRGSTKGRDQAATALEVLVESGPANLHAELWRAAGNPVLRLFSEIFTAISLQQSPSAAGGQCDADDHEPIFAALRADDRSLARHRLMRHLGSL